MRSQLTGSRELEGRMGCLSKRMQARPLILPHHPPRGDERGVPPVYGGEDKRPL